MQYGDINAGWKAVQPVWEVLDLQVDGSSTPVTITPTKTAVIWTRLIWHFVFDDNTIDVDVFGGETAGLTNGIDIYIYGTKMTDLPIKTNSDFYRYGYDVAIFSDDRVPVRNVLSSRWSFFKSAPRGIVRLGDPADDFTLVVQDDLRTATKTTLHAVSLCLQGWEHLT